MNIAGLQKMTLLDFPGKVACTVFLQGCNFRCPFCHNSDLLPGQGQPLMDHEELLAFLQKRRGLLDGVCVTGGEPTLQPQLPQLLSRIKELGYAVKLDTNGCFPDRLKALVEEGLVDYVAMDVKNSPARYGETAGFLKLDIKQIQQSIAYLKQAPVDYEFRTTVVEGLHTADDLVEIAQWLQGAKAWYLQQFRQSDQVPNGNLTPPTHQQMHQYLALAQEYFPAAMLRGVD